MAETNKIDQFLLLFTKYTDGQLPYGILADIAVLLDKSRERVRQRAQALGLMSAREPDRECVNCSKPLSNRNIQVKYCSGDCRRAAYAKKYWIDKTCPVCGKDIHTRRTEDKIYCSNACKTSAILPLGRKNVHKRNPQTLTCAGCGVAFEAVGFRSFCTKACYLKNQDLVSSHAKTKSL